MVARQLGIDRAVLVGYSMGGPISLTITRRHPDFVAGIVVQATALEWLATRRDRWQWRFLPVLGSLLRSRWYPAFLRGGLPRLIPTGHELNAVPRRGSKRRSTAATRTRSPKRGGRSSSFDARTWARSLEVPAGSLITTKDRLVRPRKQRALAAALSAEIRELGADHSAPSELPGQFSSLTVELVADVVGRSALSGSTAVTEPRVNVAT